MAVIVVSQLFYFSLGWNKKKIGNLQVSCPTLKINLDSLDEYAMPSRPTSACLRYKVYSLVGSTGLLAVYGKSHIRVSNISDKAKKA